jgi:thiol-disulfide isomerase/thioredoxin
MLPAATSKEGSMYAAGSLAILALFAAPADSVLVQFASQSCQHCQAMQPVVAQLAQQGQRVQVIDVNQQPDVARQFNIKGVPTFVAFAGGQETGRIEGATTLDKLAHLTRSPSDSRPPTPDRRLSPDQAARSATVRLKVEDATGYGFGTGTIIDTHDSEALVVTCGHLFRESKGQGKITADLFMTGTPQTVDGQLVAYDLDRDIALVSLRVPVGTQPAKVAPAGFTVRPGDRVFTIGCDKGAEPSVRPTHITAVNKYRGKPNYTAAGQPIDGRSGGGLFSAEGHLIGICNAADPADDEGLYAGLASIHWQLDQIGQSEIYQRSARVASTISPPQLPSQLPRQPDGAILREREAPAEPRSQVADIAPVAAGDDTEIVFIVRSKRDPAQRSEVYVVDGAAPDLIARITHAARASGEQRAALARSNQPQPVRTAANQLPGALPVVRGQTAEY